eukprot:PhF_6_TR7884/c1_g1_i1/m.11580
MGTSATMGLAPDTKPTLNWCVQLFTKHRLWRWNAPMGAKSWQLCDHGMHALSVTRSSISPPAPARVNNPNVGGTTRTTAASGNPTALAVTSCRTLFRRHVRGRWRWRKNIRK